MSIALADPADLDSIHCMRHDIYARELGQHAVNGEERLSDLLDDKNMYIVARTDASIAGFISITPPDAPCFSIDKYFERASLPVQIDSTTYEVRILSIAAPSRGGDLAAILLYAAYRWIAAHGGTRVVAIGRAEMMSLYERIGLRPSGMMAHSGKVRYEFMHTTIEACAQTAQTFQHVVARLERRIRWDLPMPLIAPASCFHGGAFFEAIGERFNTLERRDTVINADVLDAWFDPAPGVTAALLEHLPWLMKTSPPTDCGGLIETISEIRGIPRASIHAGAGSSDVIFRFFLSMLRRDSRVLLLDPTYGEYAHIFESVIRCRVDRFPLLQSEGYIANLDRLARRSREDYDLIVIVNPNSPTGQHIGSAELRSLLRTVGKDTLVWVDETYIDYVGANESLESFAASSVNVLVCKSMSKVYALSGMRVAYLCGAVRHIEHMRSVTPPWVVGLPAQLAAVRALQNPEYYAARYTQTHTMRAALADGLTTLSCNVVPGVANFLLVHLPENGLLAAELVKRAAAEGLYLRDAGRTNPRLGDRAIRIAVKDPYSNARMLGILQRLTIER